jgi:hypothetical protein
MSQIVYAKSVTDSGTASGGLHPRQRISFWSVLVRR